MGKRCAITGKTTSFGRNASFSKRRTNRTFGANLQTKRIFVPELGRTVRLTLSTSAVRSIDRHGLTGYLASQGKTLRDLKISPTSR
jgi:large subunit ribosomal protein L28